MNLLLNPLKQRQLQLLALLSRTNSNASRFLTSSIDLSSVPIQNQNPKLTLTEEELTRINLLIPRLCISDHLITALNLTVTALSTNPPPNSISLTILIHSLTSESDLTQTMSFLTRLRHARSSHPHLTSITSMLIAYYLRKCRPKEAIKIYNWVRRPGSVCEIEPRVYSLLVGWFCRNGPVLEGLKLLRDMISARFVPGEAVRKEVFRSLLREARVMDAKKLDGALSCLAGGTDDDEDYKIVLALLDQLVVNLTE